MAALVDAVGSDLRELASAASQLVADTDGMVDESAVHRYYRGRAEVTGFTIAMRSWPGICPARWSRCAGPRGRRGAGVDRRRAGRRRADGGQGVRRASGQLLRAWLRELGMPPWKVDKARTAGRGWSPAGLAAGMAVVAELNAAVKGAAADPEYALEKAVIDLVARAWSASRMHAAASRWNRMRDRRPADCPNAATAGCARLADAECPPRSEMKV